MLRLLFVLIFISQCLVGEEVRYKLTAGGSSVILKPADRLSLRVGVITQDKTVESSMKANGEKMQKIIAKLKEIGLTDEEYQTGSFSIAPQYTQRPKEAPNDWHPAVVGYEVRNMLSIHTNNLELAGSLIDAAGKAGANVIDDITFSLQDPQKAQAEAIAKAVQQARGYAEAAAKEAQIQLRNVLDLVINPANINMRFPKAEQFALMAENTATPITPGDVEVSASVSIVYEIEEH